VKWRKSRETAVGLDAYFARVGYLGGRTPTLEALDSIIACHMEAVPFENLNPLLRWAVRLDPASLEEKMVRGVAADTVLKRICSSRMS
jgi:N-hydroxyarylamine O-acetyltransferase